MTATFPLEIGVEAHYYLLPGMETSRTTYYYARLPTSVGALGWSSAKIPKQKMRQYYGRMYCPNSPLINELGRITAKIPKQKLRQYYGRMYCPNSALNHVAAENRPVNLRKNSAENPAEGYLR